MRDRRGSAVLVGALALVPLCGLVGLAVDYGRAFRYKSSVTRLADAAALAAARYATDKANLQTTPQVAAQAKNIAKSFFNAGLTRIGPDLTVAATPDVTNTNGSWTAKVNFSGTMTTSFARLFGVSTFPISGAATATMSPGFPVLDIAMCVDSTGSMQPTLDSVKSNALSFFDNLNAELSSRGMQPFPLVRVRMIYFKDYGGFGNFYGAANYPGDPDPMKPSAFFSLPSEASNFSSFVSPQSAYGGGDTPESGLECLNAAIDSPWLKIGQTPTGFTAKVTDVYPIIVIWTDAPAHLPNYADSLAHAQYPDAATMPRDLPGLLAKWNDGTKIDQTHKQIVFFGNPGVSAPDNYGSTASGWTTVKTWPKFTLGGTLTEANASMIELLATGIASNGAALRLTQ